MDPLSALACLASAAAEASPTEAADTPASMSVDPPLQQVRSSASYSSSFGGVRGDRSGGSGSGGGGSGSGPSHHIFSYSSQYFHQPTAPRSNPRFLPQNGVHHGYGGGGHHHPHHASGGLCRGRYDDEEEEVQSEPRPSLANYMASLGKGPLPKPSRKQRPTRSTSLASTSSSRESSPVPSGTHSQSQSQNSHHDDQHDDDDYYHHHHHHHHYHHHHHPKPSAR
mmetsp:Transcript_17665/g.39150  ORF Transcript_17665/g.39150 Transcript_17665/m.39150 type:complete len:224 (+) Transcript_17665:294-965(+)